MVETCLECKGSSTLFKPLHAHPINALNFNTSRPIHCSSYCFVEQAIAQSISNATNGSLVASAHATRSAPGVSMYSCGAHTLAAQSAFWPHVSIRHIMVAIRYLELAQPLVPPSALATKNASRPYVHYLYSTASEAQGLAMSPCSPRAHSGSWCAGG